MFHAKLVSLWNLYSGNSKVKFELYKHCNTLNCAVLYCVEYILSLKDFLFCIFYFNIFATPLYSSSLNTKFMFLNYITEKCLQYESLHNRTRDSV